MSRDHRKQMLPFWSRLGISDLKRTSILLALMWTIVAISAPLPNATAQYAPVPSPPSQNNVFVSMERVQNERCVQKTFNAPIDKNAALLGAFLLRLLPDELREQTSWRYSEENNTITIYGPEKSIEFAEKIFADFSEPLYKAFLSSGDFAGVAGVAPKQQRELSDEEIIAEKAKRSSSYYDPLRNEMERVAYEPEGMIAPTRKEYAVTFGGGDAPLTQSQASLPTNNSAYSTNDNNFEPTTIPSAYVDQDRLSGKYNPVQSFPQNRDMSQHPNEFVTNGNNRESATIQSAYVEQQRVSNRDVNPQLSSFTNDNNWAPQANALAPTDNNRGSATLQSAYIESKQSSNDNKANLNSVDDSRLDVATYQCLPSRCDSLELALRQNFGSNTEIAFNVDRRLGTIVVHTNVKWQRVVKEFLASFQVYPAQHSSYEPDMRIAAGIVAPIDGIETSSDSPQNIARSFMPPTQQTPTDVQPKVSSSALEDVYRPQFRKVDELQDSLLQLFGDRLQRCANSNQEQYTERQIVRYRFIKRQDEHSSLPKVCEISVDSLHNQISIQGDGSLCSQMFVLLRAMDQPPLRNGNVRKFIPIRNGDSHKLRQIFEYESMSKSASKSLRHSLSLNTKIFDYETDNSLDGSNRRSLTERFSDCFHDVVNKKDDLVQAQKNSYNALNYAYEAVAAINAPSHKNNGGIRQVSYQEGDVSTTPSTDYDYQPERSGVGVVQDFAPTVLQDLDVVIVDNATDAEFERIKQMIEQIEELSKIADISTEIYNLEYVDCAMLHGVLTTLYSEMFTTKQGRVVFYALQNPNAILVAGWGQAFQDMKELIGLFDRPIADGSGTMRVIRLKYASADEIAELLADAFVTPQTTGSGGLAPRIRAFADVRTNSLVVQASPNDWTEVQKLLLELDVNKTSTKLTTRVFTLKNSLAENIRQTIMNAILPAKQGTLDTTAAKFPVLELLSVDESGQRLVESGIMMDVDVTADVFHNQLIVNAPEDCMEFMERLIELLDVAPKKAQIRFFQVRHGDATQIMKTLQSLLASSDDNLSTPTLPQAEGEESFVPVRFALDTRTNVIIAAAAPKELAIVDALIVALDVKDATEREEVVVQLRNIQALVVAQAIDDYLSQKQALETTSEVLSNYQLYESQVIVIPESISNSIIVSAAPEYMDKILEMIQTFDKDPAQVVIQVLIAEVTLSNQEEFGIEAGLQNSTSFDRSLIHQISEGNATGDPGFDIVNSSGPGQNMAAGTNPKSVAGQVLNNFGLGTSNTNLGYGGFVVSASSRSVDITLRALREKNRLQILSRPQGPAMDNQQAFILVGQRVPRINGTTTTNYGVQMNTIDTPVGLILLVTPRVTKDGRVVMEIGAEKSNLNNNDAIPIYSQDGQTIKSPSIDTIQTMTAISARDGETVMLGGLLTSSKEKVSRGVPYISDVPLLGWLFRYDNEIVTRKELLIVMTPRIMRSSDDFAETMRVEVGRTNINLEEAMSINGNMGLYDPATNQGFETKTTKRLGEELLCPDRMDELDLPPSYSPNTDYRSRPVEPMMDDNVRTSYRKTSDRKAGHNSSVPAQSSRRYTSRKESSDDEDVIEYGPKRVERLRKEESPEDSYEPFLLNDDSDMEEEVPLSSRRKETSKEMKGISKYRTSRNEVHEMSRNFDDATTTTRGQIIPYQQAKESSNFKLLRWNPLFKKAF